MASKPLRAVGNLPGPQTVAVTSQDRAEVPTGGSQTCSVGGNAPRGSRYGRQHLQVSTSRLTGDPPAIPRMAVAARDPGRPHRLRGRQSQEFHLRQQSLQRPSSGSWLDPGRVQGGRVGGP